MYISLGMETPFSATLGNQPVQAGINLQRFWTGRASRSDGLRRPRPDEIDLRWF